jgi:PAS domain S-box-containing protein
MAVDDAGGITFVNATFSRLTGFSPEELHGRRGSDLVALAVPLATTASPVPTFHAALATKTGAARQVAWEVSPLASEHGDSGTLWLGLALQDVAEPGRTEEVLSEKNRQLVQAVSQLEASTNMLQCIIESIPARVFWKDTASRYLGGNRLFARDAGLSEPAELVGKDDYALGWRDQADLYRQEDQAVMNSRAPRANITEPQTTPDGRTIWLSTTKVPLLRPDGVLLGLLGVYEDITEKKQAIDSLQESERRLHTLLSNLPGMAYRCENSPDWPMVFVSEGCAPLTGWSTAELMANQPAYGDLIVPADRQAVWDAVQQAVSTQQAFELNYQIQTKQGTISWVWERGRGVFGSDGALLFLEGFIIDITYRKVAEARLRESESRYRALVESTLDWVWEIDALGRYTYISPRIRDLIGFDPAEVIGKTPFDLMPEYEARRVAAAFAPIVARRDPIVGLENTLLHRDGRLVVVETTGQPIFGPDGQFQGYRGLDRDITARRQAEQALRLRGAALEAAANAIVLTDHLGQIEWANRAFADLSGSDPGKVTGRNLRDLLEPSATNAANHEKLWATVYSGQVWRGEVVSRRQDGQKRDVDMTLTPLRDERGEIAHFIAIQQDITERKQLEAQFLQSQRMEAIGTLAGGVAHDLNNILSPMLMVSGVLEDRLSDENDREILAMLQREARRGAEIIKQLLTFSRGLAGERALIQPRHIVKEMMTMLRETFPREIDLQQHVPSDLWTVIADATQVHQILLNLCVNARDAMPDGGHLMVRASNVTLAADGPSLPPGAAPGHYVRIEVSDTGHGIPPEIRHRIFDPFYTTKPLGKGTGLGLSTVLGIVQNHGGYLTFESEPDRGTTFQINLPAPAGQSVDIAAPAAPLAPPRGQNQLILLVDDERNVRESLRLLLIRHGYRVLVATQGQDALKLFHEHRAEVALVLTDLMMPVMNGIALIRQLRILAPDLPVMATSGLGEIGHQAELATLGVPDVLMKPCEVGTLLDTIHARLQPV